MPRRSILSATERESLLALPDAKDELIRQYTINGEAVPTGAAGAPFMRERAFTARTPW